MSLSRLTKITGPGIATDTNLVGNNANLTGITTTGTSFNVGVTTIHSTLIESHNIKSTGIITATGAHFSGDVSIGGTLTYEDTTNIDSVGLITARDGIRIPNNTGKLELGSSQQFDLSINGSGEALINTTGVLNLATTSFRLRRASGSHYLMNADQGGSLYLYHNGSERLRTTATGIRVGTGVTIESNGNSNFVGVSSIGTGATGAVYLYNPDADALSGTTNDIYGWKAKTYTGGLQVNSTLYLSRSGANGLSLSYNNATGGYINQSVGFLNISCPGGLPIYLNAYQHVLKAPDNKNRIVINNSNDQAVHLYHNNVLKFSTAASGVNISGIVTATSADINGDLDVDGHTNLDNVSIVGIVTISAGTNNEGLRITGQNNNAVIFTSPSINSSAGYRLNHHPATNFLRVDTTDQNGTYTGTVASFSSAGLDMADNIKLRLGTSQDLTLYHYGNNAYIDNATGSILIRQGGSERLRLESTGNLTQSSTGSFQIAKGTTAQRPSGVAGMVRYNTTTSKIEYYDGSAWQSLKNTFDGSGGNSTYTFGGYKIHVFTSNGNFTVTGAGTVDALIVAGGGGAGASDRGQYNGAWSGGGGGGGVLWQQSISVASGTTYSIVIGNGGAVQNNGQNSTAFGYTAIGGGRGGGTSSAGTGNVNWNGASGGSGGGGLGDRVGPMQGGSGTSGQGNSGANGTDPGGSPNYEQGGGGGGAGEAGNTDGIGFGGDGRDMSGEFGTSVGENGYFGGGGAGGQGTDNSASVNSGGLGGGGDSGGGYQNNSYASQAGQANTGGGGGAGGNASGGGAGGQAGGSGIVLVRYAL